MKTPIGVLLDRVDWQAVEGDVPDDDEPLPFVTHEGVFEFGGLSLHVYQLSDGRRVINAEDMRRLFSIGAAVEQE